MKNIQVRKAVAQTEISWGIINCLKMLNKHISKCYLRFYHGKFLIELLQ